VQAKKPDGVDPPIETMVGSHGIWVHGKSKELSFFQLNRIGRAFGFKWKLNIPFSSGTFFASTLSDAPSVSHRSK
jgi:hypothetical protein